jgi:primosomal protein N' (replication factor Y)
VTGLWTQKELEAAAHRVFVRVALDRGIDADGAGGGAGRGLTYLAEDVRPADAATLVGRHVEAPLGRQKRAAHGIVVEAGGRELLEGFDPARVKSLIRIAETRLAPPLIDLGRWMASYYMAPLGLALATMTPAAVKRATGQRTRLELERTGAEPVGKLPPQTRAAWEAVRELPERSFPARADDLARAAGASSRGPIKRLVKLGLLREVRTRYVSVPVPMLDPRLTDGAPVDPVSPTRAQQEIIAGITESLGSFSAHLLRGVTGSGKTEVYLRVIQRVLAEGGRGGSALVLVPEIALTPQTAARFLRRFEREGVAVLHSGLSASERNRQWGAAASGEARVVIGARSAVFAPLPRLGLIIVDEEHASDYKQDQAPRYHARDVAVKRAQIEQCPVILGSATPALESWANATGPKPRYRLWELTERVGGGRLPKVEVVDLAAERRLRARMGDRRLRLLGPTLERALLETLEDGGQVILLLNRRGWASWLCCPRAACGWTAQCESCDAGLVWHKAGVIPTEGVVRCHHCLAEQKPPKLCPLCGSKVTALGMGSQRLEEEIGQISGLGPEQMLRVDSDSMRSASDYFDALSRFASGELRLLLGTQMISKGLDFPNVRLVGVVSADTALNIPDWRASERTFQLVSQVAGRAGRGAGAGRVVVQTMSPDAAPIRCAAAHDYLEFARGELKIREFAGLPPYGRAARIVVRDESPERAMEEARRITALLREIIADMDARPGAGAAASNAAGSATGARTGQLRIEGPAPCVISRIADRARVGIELYAPTARALHGPLEALRTRGAFKNEASAAIDIDPVALM